MTGRLGIGTLLVAAAVALAACSGTSANTTPTSPGAVSGPSSPAASCTVGGSGGTSAEIKNFAFPANLTVAAGGSITFTNADSATHTVTMDNGACDAGRIASGQSATITFTAPGTYTFHCTIHPTMKGTVVVSG
jgi:plastocyanin